MHQPIRKFRSDISIFVRPLFIFFIPLGLFMFVMGMAGAYKHGFSNLPDLLFVLFFPWICFLILCLLLAFMRMLFTITVFHNGIKCYDAVGFYHFVKWNEITKVYRQSVEGIPYVFVEARELKRSLTIPLYLEDMEDFVNLIKKKDVIGFLADELY